MFCGDIRGRRSSSVALLLHIRMISYWNGSYRPLIFEIGACCAQCFAQLDVHCNMCADSPTDRETYFLKGGIDND